MGVKLAQQHDLLVLTNRPLNGSFADLRGICRFTSDLPFNSVLQEEDVDQLEAKLTRLALFPVKQQVDEEDEYSALVTGQLGSKTLAVLSALNLGPTLCS